MSRGGLDVGTPLRCCCQNTRRRSLLKPVVCLFQSFFIIFTIIIIIIIIYLSICVLRGYFTVATFCVWQVFLCSIAGISPPSPSSPCLLLFLFSFFVLHRVCHPHSRPDVLPTFFVALLLCLCFVSLPPPPHPPPASGVEQV